MEDILDLYAEPPDPRRPVICFDERPCQLIRETRTPLPTASGHPRRHDYEYRREGTCNLFAFFDPHRGWRHLKVTAHRRKDDFAACMEDLVEQHYPEAERIRVVLDNLNTHRLEVLYQCFPASQAGRLRRKLEFHHTPVHASWLNQVEIEFSVLSRQCLNRRIGDLAVFIREVTAWAEERNARQATVDWQFTSEKARDKMAPAYPA